jgi:hypothetical protein
MPLKEVTVERVLLERAARAAVNIYLVPLYVVVGTSAPGDESAEFGVLSGRIYS